MPSHKYTHWAIVYNATKPSALETAQRLQTALKHFGAAGEIFDGPPANFARVDAVATIGGDGTILGCVPAALQAGVPVVGVNLGKLGYLASVDRNSLEESFEKIVKGEFREVERSILQLELYDGQQHLALNDIVIKSSEYRLAEMKVTVDGEFVSEYHGDGLIFATPTGATAYNLSAGGPIMHLSTEGIVMTPICPHTLTARSVVFGCDSVLRVEPGRRHAGVHITVDGRNAFEGSSLKPIAITQSKEKLITLENPKNGQFEILRKKLGW